MPRKASSPHLQTLPRSKCFTCTPWCRANRLPTCKRRSHFHGVLRKWCRNGATTALMRKSVEARNIKTRTRVNGARGAREGFHQARVSIERQRRCSCGSGNVYLGSFCQIGAQQRGTASVARDKIFPPAVCIRRQPPEMSAIVEHESCVAVTPAYHSHFSPFGILSSMDDMRASRARERGLRWGTARHG